MNDQQNRNHVMDRPYYGDFRFYHPDGTLMFIASQHRANWYIKRDLVKRDSTDPKKFVFKKKPEGYGFWHSSLHYYHLIPKKNRCVVCGTTERLTKHHVLPVIFQRHYPNERHDAGVRSHDMLLLCLDCHQGYEQEYANPVREEWAAEYGASQDHRYTTNLALTKAVKAAKALVKGQLKPKIKRKLLRSLGEFLGKSPTKKHIDELASLTWRDTKELLKTADLGKKVTDAWDLGELRKFWRRHFVESMKPQFLPEGWSVDAPVERQFMKGN